MDVCVSFPLSTSQPVFHKSHQQTQRCMCTCVWRCNTKLLGSRMSNAIYNSDMSVLRESIALHSSSPLAHCVSRKRPWADPRRTPPLPDRLRLSMEGKRCSSCRLFFRRPVIGPPSGSVKYAGCTGLSTGAGTDTLAWPLLEDTILHSDNARGCM